MAFRPAAWIGHWAATLTVAAILWCEQSLAQAPMTASDTEVSKETENPVTRQITLPLRYEADLNDGFYKDTKSTFEIDNAIVPFRLNEDWALITRTKFPLISLPPKKKNEGWTTGLGNAETTFFLSPERGRGFYWGVGPIVSFPTATNSALGTHAWGIGPSVAFLKSDESPWVLGAIINNVWTFSNNPSNRSGKFLLNPFFSYHFDEGWSVGSSPDITANWSASGDKWTVPLGGGFSKVVRVGEQPIKLALDAYYNVIRPKTGNDQVVLQFTMTFQFPD